MIYQRIPEALLKVRDFADKNRSKAVPPLEFFFVRPSVAS